MNIMQLRYFQMVIKTGSFSDAAAELHISQSSLSKRIAALEAELNVSLFDRTTRKVTISPAGKIFLKYVEEALTNYHNVIKELKEFSVPEKGILTIATIPIMAQYNITSLITGFREKYTDIAIHIKETEKQSIVDSIESLEYSLAFLRAEYVDDRKFSVIPFAKDTLSVCVFKNHPLARRSSLGIEDIKDEKLILLDPRSGIYDICISAYRNAGFEPNILYTNTRIETIIGLVVAGQGITLLMDKVVRFFNNSDISVIPLKNPVTSTIALVKPLNQKLTSNEKLFWNYMSSMFPS